MSAASAGSGQRLVLVRHGQTASNVARALDTRPPGAPLNDLGRAQAAALAERVTGDPVVGPIGAVYASTATRAQQTAAPVAAALGLDVRVIEGAHEIFVGDLENRSDVEAREEFERVYTAWERGDLDARPPGGESARELRERFAAAIAGMTAPTTGAALLVSHGAAIRLGAAALLGDTAEPAYLGNTGVVVLSANGGGWSLEHWDPAPPRPGDVTAGGDAD
jgi:probable phosphoglycerate mutase